MSLGLQNRVDDVLFAEVGMDVEKARAAMNVGVAAARRQQIMNQQYYANLQAQRRRAEIARRNQQIYAARQRQQSYWSRLGVSIYKRNFYRVILDTR